MLTISIWPRRLKEFLLTHPLYKSPDRPSRKEDFLPVEQKVSAHHVLNRSR